MDRTINIVLFFIFYVIIENSIKKGVIYMDNYKLKVSIFISLFITLLVTLYYGIFGFSVSYLSVDEIKENRKLKKDLINFFDINNLTSVIFGKRHK